MEGVETKTQRVARRVPYFDFLRIIATVAVIMIHVSCYAWLHGEIGGSAWGKASIWNGVSRWAVPIFVMISGALFLNPEKNFDMRKMVRKNILRLVVAFFFWSIAYICYRVLFCNARDLGTIITAFFSGYYHMWFIVMIIGLYLATPLIRQITKRRELMEYFLIIGIILTFCIIAMDNILEMTALNTSNRVISIAYSVIHSFNKSLNPCFFVGYVTYYVLGYYLSSTQLKKKVRILLYIVGVLGFLFTIFFSKVISLKKGMLLDVFGDLMPGVLAEAVAVFVLAKQLKKRLGKICELTAKLSFGIYLVHVLVLEIILKLYPIEAEQYGHLLTIGLVIVVFVISWIISWIISKIPLLKWYVI